MTARARSQYRAEQVAARTTCPRTLGTLTCKGRGAGHTHRFEAAEAPDPKHADDQEDER